MHKIRKISISISFPLEWLEKLDKKAREENASRSDYVVRILEKKIFEKQSA